MTRSPDQLPVDIEIYEVDLDGEEVTFRGERLTEAQADAIADKILPPVSLRGALHHIELWVGDLASATSSLGWLLEELGYAVGAEWSTGKSWAAQPLLSCSRWWLPG